MKVFVYRNLHQKCWSVKSLEKESYGRVLFHTMEITLRDCELKVSESGRQKVLLEKRKNVHAGVVGYIDAKVNKTGSLEITYNPYKYNSFVAKTNKKPVLTAEYVTLTEDMKVFINKA